METLLPKRREPRPEPLPLGARVKSYRANADLTQMELAERIGTDSGYIARIEAGKIPDPGISNVTKLARALGVSVASLIGEEERRSVLAAIQADDTLTDRQKRALLAIVEEMTRKR